jgi:hypothetical protein
MKSQFNVPFEVDWSESQMFFEESFDDFSVAVRKMNRFQRTTRAKETTILWVEAPCAALFTEVDGVWYPLMAIEPIEMGLAGLFVSDGMDDYREGGGR